MPCTTILVGKNASYDGSTMIARNDDSGAGHFTPKKFVVVSPEEQPVHYKSVNPLQHMNEFLVRIHSCNTFLVRMDRRSGQAALAKRIWWFWSFLTFTVQERASSAWERCWSSTEPMR